MAKKLFSLAGMLLMLVAFFTVTARAQVVQSTAAAAPTLGFRAEFIRQLDDVEKKLVDLAGAMPQEKYTWRPGEGVRSVSEVYMHVVGANFFTPQAIGFMPPGGLTRDMEKTVTEKAKVTEMLKQSFQHVKNGVIALSDTALDRPAKLCGQETTVRNVLFTVALHMHEHLGQSIAYARMNGVVPPWTAERQSQQRERPRE